MRVNTAEKQTILVLRQRGTSTQEIATLMGLDISTIRRHLRQIQKENGAVVITPKKPVVTFKVCTQETMFTIFDLYASGIAQKDIAEKLGYSYSTVCNVITRYYKSHKIAYSKWLELQKEKDAPDLVMEVQPVEEPAVHPAILAIRAARAAGRTSHPAPVEPVEPECVDFQSKYFALLEEHSRVMSDYIKSLKSL